MIEMVSEDFIIFDVYMFYCYYAILSFLLDLPLKVYECMLIKYNS